MESNCKSEAYRVLQQLIQVINQLDYDEYTLKIPLLSTGTIGAHTRHIIELFEQLNLGYCSGTLNYDDRKREVRIENEIDFATERIAHIIQSLPKPNKTMQLKTLYHDGKDSIETSYERELVYNIEHCIHHQAIIKIGLIYLGKDMLDEAFGLAKSTLLNNLKCAQ